MHGFGIERAVIFRPRMVPRFMKADVTSGELLGQCIKILLYKMVAHNIGA
jgi:hypothetical protein